MKAKITDASALQAITPVALASYARANGWRKSEAFGEHANAFIGSDRPEILIPHTDTLLDYVRTVARLLEIFADVAGRDQLSLYRDLVNADDDVIRVRATMDASDGSVAIEDGVNLVRNAQRLLLATACAVDSPQPVYRAGANKVAQDYMKKVRLGQTEHGSFVVTMLTTIPPRIQTVLDLSNVNTVTEPMERRVSIMLHDALRAAKSAVAIASAGDGTPFGQEAVDRGVSANLCEAISNLVMSGDKVEVGIAWAKTRPVEGNFQPVAFTSSDADILKEGARFLRERTPYEDYKLRGFISRLNRDETATSGTVIVKGFVEEKSVSVSVPLEEPEYHNRAFPNFLFPHSRQVLLSLVDRRKSHQNF